MTESLAEENIRLKKRIDELEDQLKRFNSTERYKKYYKNENNAEKVKDRNKNYVKKLNLTYRITHNRFHLKYRNESCNKDYVHRRRINENHILHNKLDLHEDWLK